MPESPAIPWQKHSQNAVSFQIEAVTLLAIDDATQWRSAIHIFYLFPKEAKIGEVPTTSQQLRKWERTFGSRRN